MITAIEHNLQRGIKLLNTISNEEYSNNSVPPYFSSIGCHMRHVLDVFTCVLKGFSHKKIDLTLRERNAHIELETAKGIAYFESVLVQIRLLSDNDLTTELQVIDDLGKGKVTSKSTLGAVLMQAQSHAIHHFASIGYIIHQLNIALPDADFGYNPTTQK